MTIPRFVKFAVFNQFFYFRTYTNDVDGIDPPKRRRRYSDLSDEEYNHVMLHGERYSLAEEEAMMCEGLDPENGPDSQTAEYEVLAEIDVDQQLVSVSTSNENQVGNDQPLDLDAYTSDMPIAREILFAEFEEPIHE